MGKKLIDQVTGNEIEIVTDGKWRPFKYGDEVPAKIRQSDFDWLNEDARFNSFICYRGRWYHLDEFMQFDDKSGPLAADGWHGYYNDSYSSGIVIKVANDGESYQIARFFC